MAHSRVEKPSDVVTEGDRVKVKVLGLDLDNEKVKLSIKETQPGPWETIEGKIQPGDVIEGTVKRLVTFGAFVEVAPQVEGLLHISQIANRHIATPSEVLSEGQEVKVKVLDVHLDDKKISLSMRALETSEPTRQDDEQALLDEYSDQGGFSVSELTGDDSSDDSK
ncbi:MAG: S1 RNA-binding domain-containing protein [Exiguobacterium sp.]|nr:S1 RNA-binding domain-containing protein [Exiguobacterium sp.]